MKRRIGLGILCGWLLAAWIVSGCSATEALAPGPTQIAAVQAEDYDVTLVFPSNDYPETALHIHGAIEQGASAICTIDREGAADNRRASLAGVDTKNGYDRDEWPMAMCAEGGAGASVAYIDASDNRGAGSWVGNRLANYPDGTRVLFVVEKPELKFGSYTEEQQRQIAKRPAASQPNGTAADAPIFDPSAPAADPSAPASPAAAGEVVYQNCAAVRAAGKAPLKKGEPGYSPKLDRDGDGVACE